MLAAMSISASARHRLLEDVVLASHVALGSAPAAELELSPARVAQDLLTEAIHKMREARGRAFGEHTVN